MDLVDVCLDLDDTGRLMAAICKGRFEVPERLRQLSAEQENSLLRIALKEFGAAGESKLRTIETARPEVPSQGSEPEVASSRFGPAVTRHG